MDQGDPPPKLGCGFRELLHVELLAGAVSMCKSQGQLLAEMLKDSTVDGPPVGRPGQDSDLRQERDQLLQVGLEVGERPRARR